MTRITIEQLDEVLKRLLTVRSRRDSRKRLPIMARWNAEYSIISYNSEDKTIEICHTITGDRESVNLKDYVVIGAHEDIPRGIQLYTESEWKNYEDGAYAYPSSINFIKVLTWNEVIKATK